MKNIKQLFNLADRSKNIGEYDLANAIFAVLLGQLLKSEANINLYWETNDMLGALPSEVYYDLAVLEYIGEDDDIDIVPSLCIPAPLLTSEAVVCFFKKMEWRSFLEKKVHNRQVILNSSKVERYWESFKELVDSATAKSAIEIYLKRPIDISKKMDEKIILDTIER